MELLRKIFSLNEFLGDDVLILSVLGGGIGTFFYLNDPIYGFCLFGWGIIFIYVILLVSFSYDEKVKKNCLLLLNE